MFLKRVKKKVRSKLKFMAEIRIKTRITSQKLDGGNKDYEI